MSNMPMRYFQSYTVNRAVSSSAGAFIFEPSIPLGGGWLGVLAVAEPTASLLAADLPVSVWEITEEDFNGVKKKAPEIVTDWRPFPPRQLPTETMAGVVPAEAPTSPSRPERDPRVRETPLESITLTTTTKQPPPEPLLEMPSDKRGRRVA